MDSRCPGALARGPFGPWVDGTPDGPAPTGPLVAVGLHDIASLYAALVKVGITPTQADDMEIWQIASALGVHEEAKKPRTMTPEQMKERQTQLARERAQRMRAESGI